MKKLSPSVKLRKEVSEFIERLQDVDSAEDVLTQLVQLSTQLITQEGLEAHQRDHLGVDRYERGEGRRGYRSGYEPGYLDTAEGRLEVAIPQVRGSDESYRCTLYDVLRGDSEMVQRLATEMYARGLSTRDIEDAFTDEQGRCLLSRSKVSEVTEVLWEQYEAFQNRDLSDLPLLCLFLDGLYEPLRTHGITREAILCAWGITLDGRKVLISLSLGNKESGEAWLEFLRDLDRRGLPTPLFITTDGAGGLIQAVDQMWSKSLRGRCWVHRMRNFASKVPKSRWHEIKPYLLMIRDAPDLEAGQKAVREFLAKFSKEFPGLCKCLTEDLDALLAQLQLPWRLRKFTRTTNLIERSFVEERRRTKTLPRFFTEKSCLKLVYAVLIRAAARWQAISITSTEYLQLRMLYEERETRSPIELGGGRLTLRRSRSRRGILQDSQDLTDLLFIQSYRAHTIPPRPEVATPIPIPKLRKPVEHLDCTLPFHETDNLRNRILRRKLHHKVNVILLNIARKYPDLTPSTQLSDDLTNTSANFALEDPITVFRTPYEVILALICRVG